ncbi:MULTISPECIES: hypothetical protein [unclassified Streptomyces]|nr:MULTISPECIES: hypothetical protein [unclassified Streptomyces]MDH3033991.1 hypothetical protein [Streptomyces sp. TRM75561]
MSSSAEEPEPDFWTREPDIIGALRSANRELDAAAKWMTLGGNPVQADDLAARLHDLSRSFWRALFAVHPWPTAFGDLEIEGKMERAAKLANELEKVLGELAKKPTRGPAG